MRTKNSMFLVFAGSVLFFAAGQNRALADETVNVTINTSSIASLPGSEIYFDFTAGSGTGDSDNTVTISGISLGGGTAGAIDTSILGVSGGESGSLTSGVTLIDSSAFNQFAQFFTAGSQLSFVMDLTTNDSGGPIPDQFSLFIYNPSGNPIASTSDPSGFDSLMIININSASPAVDNYDTTLVTATTSTTVVTPEPSTLLLSGLGSILMASMVMRRKFPRAG
jgi:hypothetical protein